MNLIAENLIANITQESSLWNDPRLATAIAALAVALLLATVWLMRRRSRDGRGAAAICLIMSVLLHAVLIYFLPTLQWWGRSGSGSNRDRVDAGLAQVSITDFDPHFDTAEVSGDQFSPTPTVAPESIATPLPVAIAPMPPETITAPEDSSSEEPIDAPETEASTEPASIVLPMDTLPDTLASQSTTASDEEASMIDDLLTQWLSDDASRASVSAPAMSPDDSLTPSPVTTPPPSYVNTTPVSAAPAHVPGTEQDDFGQRVGDAKRIALFATGGDESTEAAVEAALRFLAADQRPDGAWDPVTSGAGRETLTLGTDRGGAGKRATNGITGLALLSMLGAGNTHLQGPYADNVRRGLSYLIRSQHPDGSLAGPATVYEANYCHGMAALAMCEAAAMTGDESAIRSAAAAVRFTVAVQHPTTGGWRYVKGDPGDLSQLGWQAMVLDGGRRASIDVPAQSLLNTGKFLRSVRSGQHGGLASYRPGEAPTRTMTAEALATRLLLGETIPPMEIKEAEAFILRQPPGIGKDNYYGWYYTALALHQLQDDAWKQWNDAMKRHLIARQLPGGSWPTDDEWGGYGGRIYTTSMAALCLEVYYRHAIRGNSQVATLPDPVRR
jgi:cell division septation protein DedD